MIASECTSSLQFMEDVEEAIGIYNIKGNKRYVAETTTFNYFYAIRKTS